MSRSLLVHALVAIALGAIAARGAAQEPEPAAPDPGAVAQPPDANPQPPDVNVQPLDAKEEPPSASQQQDGTGQQRKTAGQQPDEMAQGTAAQERRSPWRFEIGLPVAAMIGQSKYRIAGSDSYGSIASELEFPLGSVLAGLQAELANGRDPGGKRWVFRLSGLTSLSGSDGTLKDSDWISGGYEIDIVGQVHDGTDVYSESRAELGALVFEGSAQLELDAARGFIVAPMVGLLYQRFHYDVYDVEQIGYGPYNTPDFTGSVSGRVLEYTVSYMAPYLGARAMLVRGRFVATADVWLSPRASAEDRDDHILRERLATTDASGTAWQASLAARLALGERSALQAQASLVQFHATGTQRQRFYGGSYAGETGEIPSSITSSRTSFQLMFIHRLGR